MSSAPAAVASDGVRIGAAAKAAGTTPRTFRYYEEIGLLPQRSERGDGAHRLYSEADIERMREILRLKHALGLSLDELHEVIEGEEARVLLRERYLADASVAERREILGELRSIVERQLELLERRRKEIAEIEDDLVTRKRKIQRRLRELS